MIKLLTDEDIPRPIIEKLRSKDVDVKSVDEDSKSISDRDVVSLGKKENRVILTFDSDYRKLAEELDHSGILLITKRKRHERVARIVYEDYFRYLNQEDMKNTLVNIKP